MKKRHARQEELGADWPCGSALRACLSKVTSSCRRVGREIHDAGNGRGQGEGGIKSSPPLPPQPPIASSSRDPVQTSVMSPFNTSQPPIQRVQSFGNHEPAREWVKREEPHARPD